MMSNTITCIIDDLSELTAKDLDACTVNELCQLKYWLDKWQGPIFVKTVGRMAKEVLGDKE